MEKLPFVFIIFFLFTAPAFAQEACLQKANTQVEMDRCGDITPDEADKELNRVYSTIKLVYKDNKEFLSALKKSQLAWLKFRDAEYETRYPGKEKQFLYGTAYRDCAPLLEAELTIKRIIELRRWLTGIAEGDVCSGSIMRPETIRENLKSAKH
jgi:uncharacterized protein YecT (DUF1311 family)